MSDLDLRLDNSSAVTRAGGLACEQEKDADDPAILELEDALVMADLDIWTEYKAWESRYNEASPGAVFVKWHPGGAWQPRSPVTPSHLVSIWKRMCCETTCEVKDNSQSNGSEAQQQQLNQAQRQRKAGNSKRASKRPATQISETLQSRGKHKLQSPPYAPGKTTRIRAEAEDLIPTISSMGKKACTRNKRMVGTSEQEPD